MDWHCQWTLPPPGEQLVHISFSAGGPEARKPPGQARTVGLSLLMCGSTILEGRSDAEPTAEREWSQQGCLCSWSPGQLECCSVADLPVCRCRLWKAEDSLEHSFLLLRSPSVSHFKGLACGSSLNQSLVGRDAGATLCLRYFLFTWAPLFPRNQQ